jgi:hypothetical protein
MVFQTTHTTAFNPSLTKTGATLYWKWPDGTYTSSNSPTKNLAAGTKRIEVQSQDGFKGVTVFNSPSLDFSGTLPSFATCTALVTFSCYTNAFSGTLPSFATCTALVTFYCNTNAFSGTLPSFATCTALVTFYCYTNAFSGTLPSFATCTALVTFSCYTNAFSGTLPSFATCTKLVTFYCFANAFSGTLPSFATCTKLVTFYCGYSSGNNQFADVVAGSFATQKSMATAHFGRNALAATAVNQILADFVVSLGISGRVSCTVNLDGGTNAAPTGQGITDRNTLVAAGWTVTVNP